VGDAAELAETVAERLPEVDALIMAAAVADFTAAERSGAKIKKSEDDGGDDSVPALALRRTRDILRHSVVERDRSATRDRRLRRRDRPGRQQRPGPRPR